MQAICHRADFSGFRIRYVALGLTVALAAGAELSASRASAGGRNVEGSGEVTSPLFWVLEHHRLGRSFGLGELCCYGRSCGGF